MCFSSGAESNRKNIKCIWKRIMWRILLWEIWALNKDIVRKDSACEGDAVGVEDDDILDSLLIDIWEVFISLVSDMVISVVYKRSWSTLGLSEKGKIVSLNITSLLTITFWASRTYISFLPEGYSMKTYFKDLDWKLSLYSLVFTA